MGETEATGQAIKLLARREHSARELQHKLAVRGFSNDDIANTLQELQAKRLQSDQRFAEEYVRARQGRGYGPLRIRAELQQRGVDRDTLGTVLDGQQALWQQICGEARRKRFGITAVQDAKERARQQRFLSYRGFTAQQIAAAFNRFMEE